MKRIKIFAMNELMPPHDNMPGVVDTEVEAFLIEFAKNAHPIMRLGFFLSVWVYVLSPLFTLGIPLPAFWLSQNKRAAHLKKYSESRSFVFSQLFMLQKMVTGMCWGADAKVRTYFGYPPYEAELGDFKKGDSL